MSTFPQNVYQRTKFLINGYIRDIQGLLASWIIPSEIMDQCFAFYFIKIAWNIEALEKGNSWIIDKTTSGWYFYPINCHITNHPRMCDIFELEITSIENVYKTEQAVWFGFVKDAKLSKYDGIFCQGNNKYHYKSEAIKIYQKTVTFNSDRDKTHIDHQLSEIYQEGDTLKMVLNLKEDYCAWYFNQESEPLATISLHDPDVILPVFCCFDVGCKYQITNYSFK